MNIISISDLTVKDAQKLSGLAHALGIVDRLNIEGETLELGQIFHCSNRMEKANFTPHDVLALADAVVKGELTLRDKIEGSEFGRAAYQLLQIRLDSKVMTKREAYARKQLKASKKMKRKEDVEERRINLNRTIDAEKRQRKEESRSEIFRIWLKHTLPQVKADLVHSMLWDDQDDANYKSVERQGVRAAKKQDTELNAFQTRLEAALGLTCKKRKGEDALIELVPENGGLNKVVKDYRIKTKFKGPRPLSNYPGLAGDVLKSSLRGDAIRLLETRLNQFGDRDCDVGGITLFEGGVDSEPGKIAISLLWERLKLASGDEDIHHIYSAWSFAVVQQDFTSNERSCGTIRKAKKAS